MNDYTGMYVYIWPYKVENDVCYCNKFLFILLTHRVILSRKGTRLTDEPRTMARLQSVVDPHENVTQQADEAVEEGDDEKT